MIIFFILVLSIPLASLYLSTILIHRFAFLISVSAILLYGFSVQILRGLFQTSSQTIWDIIFKILFIFLLCGSGYEEEGGSLGESYILFSDISFQVSLLPIPVIVYSNADTAKSTILVDNKEKAGIYMWIHKESGKRYIGSAFDLSSRLGNYFNKTYIKSFKNVYIYNALLHHGYSAFSLSILELISISNLSKEEARKIILEREQVYLDLIFKEAEPNTYNILTVAGSSLGYKHTEESLAKISGVCHPNYGKPLSSDSKNKLSISKGGGTIFVYNSDSSLVNSFPSARKAAEELNCDHKTIIKYTKSGKLFRDQWILSTSLK